jgi:MFS family permease
MMLAPSVPQVLQKFRPDGSDKYLGSFSVTVYILGFVVGPLLLGPLTDIMGRILYYGLRRPSIWYSPSHVR